MLCDREPEGNYSDTIHRSWCRPCRALAWANHEVPAIAFGAVPGGTRPASFAKAKAKKFEKDMNAYREARRHGMSPDQISTQAVETEEKIAYGVVPEYHRLQR
jgi:hypothetical protein